ncbi:MAG: class II glutamine amidotransferase [Pseudomonadales bacterium]
MCRFLLYMGKPIHLSSLITEPENSLIHQSFDSRERAEPLNGDGFGVAWYTDDGQDAAALFRSITPAWNNQNLRHLARAVRSRCVLAHVRAASPGLAVTELNTHPFVHGPFSFMHNGNVADYRHHRRSLQAHLDEAHYQLIEGSTDSECLFALTLQALDRASSTDVAAMAEALEWAIATTLAHQSEHGVARPSFVNAVLSNGDEAVACRYTSAADQPPASLHLHTGMLYACRAGTPELLEAEEDAHSVIVASEALTGDASWRTVPAGSMVLIDRDRDVEVRPIRL